MNILSYRSLFFAVLQKCTHVFSAVVYIQNKRVNIDSRF